MPLAQHRELSARCSDSDREYAILNSGVLMPSLSNNKEPRIVVIVCQPEQVKLIVDFAMRVYPEAVSAIKEYTTTV
jgi:hypothetical protein